MLAVKDYNRLVNRNQKVANQIAKTQRERDLKVDTINKKYEQKIDRLLRKSNELQITVKNTKEFVAKN